MKCRIYCAVFNCLNSSLSHPKMTFFRLPGIPERRLQWMQLIRRDDLKNKPNYTSYRVCEKHFNAEDVLQKSKRKLLKKSALPLLMLPSLTSSIPGVTLKEDQQTQTVPLDCATSLHGPSSSVTPDTIAGTGTSGSLRCSFCSSPLQKIYKCVQCEDVMLCDYCERTDRHPIHCVLRIASEELYMKVKRTFPTLHQLFDILLTEDEDSDDADSDATRSATENDVEDEIQNTSKVCSNVTDRTKSQNKYIKSHSKAEDHKMGFKTTDTKHRFDSRNSRKRKHNKVAGNTKKPLTAHEVNITIIDEPTIHLTETSPAYNDPLYIDYTIKTEPVGEDNTENLEIIDTNELIIEDDIKQEVKEESDDEDMSDKVSAARVTYLCRAPSNIK